MIIPEIVLLDLKLSTIFHKVNPLLRNLTFGSHDLVIYYETINIEPSLFIFLKFVSFFSKKFWGIKDNSNLDNFINFVLKTV